MIYRYGVLPSQGVWFRREQEGAARRAGGGISRRQFAKLGAAAAAAAAIGTTGMFAYFTDEDSKANDLSVSPDLDIEVVEPSWVEEDARDMEPGQTVPKDPAVRNKSASAEGWVFLEIHVPMAEVVVYDPAAGTVSDASAKELFSYEADLSRWYLLKSFEALEGGVRTKVYRYAWPDVLKPGETTAPVFSEITLANLVNDQGQAGEHVVTAVGRGIQSYGFSTPEEAWAALGIVDDEYEEHKQVNALTVTLASPPAGGRRKKLVLMADDVAPSVGEQMPDGSGTVTTVVENVEPMAAANGKSPLTVDHYNISSVEILSPTKPENAAFWFAGLSNATTFDLKGLDTTDLAKAANLFEGCTAAVEIRTGAKTKTVTSFPAGRWTVGGEFAVNGGEDYETAATTTYVNSLLDKKKMPYWALYGQANNATGLTLVLGTFDMSDVQGGPSWTSTSEVFARYPWGTLYKQQLNFTATPGSSEITNTSDIGERWVANRIPSSHNGQPLLDQKASGLGACCNILYGKGIPEFIDAIKPYIKRVHVSPGLELYAPHDFGKGRYKYQGDFAVGSNNWLIPSLPAESVDLSAATVHYLGCNKVACVFSFASASSVICPRFADDCNVTSAVGMFSGNAAARTIDISNLDISAATLLDSMFAGCEALEGIAGDAGWNVAACNSASYMFAGCAKLALDTTDWPWSDFIKSKPIPNMSQGWAFVSGPFVHFNYHAPGVIVPEWLEERTLNEYN